VELEKGNEKCEHKNYFSSFLVTSFRTGQNGPILFLFWLMIWDTQTLGCYGGEIKTPNLDRLAKNGIRYTQAYNTSKCWTTRISLLTGLYHHRSNRDFDNTALIGEILKPAGYRTWWSGKHHANFNPYNRGFDHFSGFLGGAINFWNPGDRARKGEEEPGWRAVYHGHLMTKS